MSLHPVGGNPDPLAQYSSSSVQQEIHSLPIPWPQPGMQCSGLPWGEELLLSPFPEVTWSLPLHFLTVN